MGNWLQHIFGFYSNAGNSPEYLFWSGAGSNFAAVSNLSLIGALVVLYRKHNCQIKGCFRIGRHEFTEPDTEVKRNLCWKHHPSVDVRQLTRAKLHLYLGDKPGDG